MTGPRKEHGKESQLLGQVASGEWWLGPAARLEPCLLWGLYHPLISVSFCPDSSCHLSPRALGTKCSLYKVWNVSLSPGDWVL